jgi:hypothetical protein
MTECIRIRSPSITSSSQIESEGTRERASSSPPKKLTLATAYSIRPFRKSTNEIIKQFQIPGKGDNETLEIVNLLEYIRAATDVIDGHEPENRGARARKNQELFY